MRIKIYIESLFNTLILEDLTLNSHKFFDIKTKLNFVYKCYLKYILTNTDLFY